MTVSFAKLLAWCFLPSLLLSLVLQDFSDYGWLDNEDEPLGGFAWRGGAERETTGILMWNEPYLMKTPEGEEVYLSAGNTVEARGTILNDTLLT